MYSSGVELPELADGRDRRDTVFCSLPPTRSTFRT
jgi:hypothetical protein